MSPQALLPLSLLFAGGCANKALVKHVGSIQSLEVTDTVWSAQARVDMGQLPIDDQASVQETATKSAANVSLAVFEAELATRLGRVVEADNLAMNTSRAAGKRLDKRGPFPTAEEADFRLDIALSSWGMRADLAEPAEAWTTLQAQLYDPTGVRIWSTSLSCTQPLAPDTGVDGLSQTVVSIGTIRGMADEELTVAYRELARVCARDVVDAFARAVDKARAKAAKKGEVIEPVAAVGGDEDE